jgi:glycosyltransferase involved in cell wall biosynthesis
MREELHEAGIQVHAAESGSFSLTGRLKRLMAFRKIVRENRDCVIALLLGNYVAGGPMILAGRLGGAKCVIRADLQPPMPPITRRHKLSIALKDRFVHRVVVGALNNIDAFVSETGRSRNKFRVVHTGIDMSRFQPDAGRTAARRNLGYTPNERVVGTISRLGEARKGMSQFLDTASAVHRDFPDARFLIIGDGPLRGDLEAQARDLGVTEVTNFAGWRSDVPAMLAAMDVFVMPSLFEGGPTTVLEAMAMAKATVATCVGMVPEVIEDGVDGLIVPPGDVTAMSLAVARVLSDEALRARMGAAARSRAEAQFSIDTMVEQYIAVFADARDGNRR